MSTTQNTHLLATGTRQNQREPEHLNPDSFSVEERSTTQWLEYLRAFAAWLRFYTPDGVNGDWQSLLNEPEGLEQWQHWLEQQPGISDAVKQRVASPDRALLLTFLQLLRHPQDQFRRITERHLTYYYRQVLGFSEQPAQGDTAHLVVTLEEGAELQTLPAGTLFDGGDDAEGNKRFYSLLEATGINFAQVASLRTLGLDTQDNDTGFLRTELVSLDQGLTFPEGGALTFGEVSEYEEDPDQRQSRPQIGLVLTSPLLWLSEGDRTITVTFHRSLNTGGDFPGTLTDLFDITLSTADGPVVLTSDQVVVVSSGMTATVTLSLDALFPPVAPVPEPVSQRITAPFIQLTLKADPASQRFSQYQLLKQIALDRVQLRVEVDGLKQVLIRNDLAPLDPGGPMELFGSQPRIGSNFQFTHGELAVKPLSSLSVDIDWANQPDNVQDYYDAYHLYLKAQGYSVSDSWPDHQVNLGSPWGSTGNSSLFGGSSGSVIQRTVAGDTNLYPAGLNWTLYRDLPIQSPEPREWPFWYQVSLENADFGHTLYNKVLTWAATENSKNLIRYQQGLPSEQEDSDYHNDLNNYITQKAAYNTYLEQKALWDSARNIVWYRVVSAENSGTGRTAQLYTSSGSSLHGGGAYTFYVSSLNPSSNQWTHFEYDMTGSSYTPAQQMANDLAGIPFGHPVLIFSGTESDHHSGNGGSGTESNRGLSDLVTQVEICGGSKAQFVDSSGSEHGAYMLIGRKGLGTGNGYEENRGSHNSSAYIDHIIVLNEDGDRFLTPSESQALYNSRNTPEPTPVAAPGSIPSPAPSVSYNPIEVNPPLVPLSDRFSINYSAETELTVENAKGDNDRLLMHLHPIGTQVVASSEKLGVSTEHPFIPSLDKSGYLYIGLDNTPDTGEVTMLFDIAAVDSPEGLAGATVRWDYLTEDGWVRFSTDRQQDDIPRAMVLGDGTNGLINTGIIRFQLLADMRRSGAFAGDHQLWLRGSLDAENSSIPSIWSRLGGIYTQAASVVFSEDSEITGQALSPLHLPEPLPAATIAALYENNPAVSSVAQPLPSSGGRAPEASGNFNNRVSERLRHRGRAITSWDYERIVLEQFPELFMARCVRGESDGAVVMQVIPNTTDPDILKPRAPLFLQNNIRDYLQPLVPPQAQVTVTAPRFQEVRFSIAVTLHEGYDQGLMIYTLNQEVVTHLSPWVNSNQSDFKNAIALTAIARYISSRPYVARVLKITAEREEWDEDNESFVFRPVSGSVILPDDQLGNPEEVILVPARLHTINVLPPGEEIFEGVGRMEIEFDFEVV